MEKHTIPPYYNSDSTILILGSFPSIKSREVGFYYSHPQNRFWQVLSIVYNSPVPQDIKSKKAFLKKHKIALFDVCASCDITSSNDASIKNVVPNNILPLLENSKITTIYTDGKTAYNLYNKYIYAQTKIAPVMLPSTSSANAKYKLENLVTIYRELLNK